MLACHIPPLCWAFVYRLPNTVPATSNLLPPVLYEHEFRTQRSHAREGEDLQRNFTRAKCNGKKAEVRVPYCDPSLQEARYNKAAFKETGKDALDPKMACLVLYEGNNTFRVAAKEIQTKLHVLFKSMQGSWPNQYELFLNATKAEQLRMKKMQALIPITQKCSDPNDPQLEAYR